MAFGAPAIGRGVLVNGAHGFHPEDTHSRWAKVCALSFNESPGPNAFSHFWNQHD